MTVEDTDTIDSIGMSPDGSAYTLLMVEPRPFKMSEEQAEQIREKINTYIYAIQTGQLYQMFPEMAGKELTVRLVCMDEPRHPHLLELLSIATRLFNKHGARFVVEVIPPEFVKGGREFFDSA